MIKLNDELQMQHQQDINVDEKHANLNMQRLAELNEKDEIINRLEQFGRGQVHHNGLLEKRI